MGAKFSKAVHSSSSKRRILQNYLLVWVDASIDETHKDCRYTLTQLRTVVNDVTVFTDPDACVDFLGGVTDEKAFVMISGSLGQALVPRIHSMKQVDTIFIFCMDQKRHRAWTSEWSKIADVFTRIEPICRALQESAAQCNWNSTPMSFLSNKADEINTDLNQLEPSFMYTQLFKNTFLEMEHGKDACEYLIEYCREKKADLPSELKILDEFQRKYRPDKAIWWYTRGCFTYQMLNRALRLLEADIMVNMGFFIHDLHRQIEQLHKKQVHRYRGQPFTVYRGQGLSTDDFDKLKKTQGALLSFNSFLSTTEDKNVAVSFAESSSQKADTVGILFIMEIDPEINTTPFANLKHTSYYHAEAEMLFSMNSVFRIIRISDLNKQANLFYVHLRFTADDDPHLRLLTTYLDSSYRTLKGWNRLAHLLLEMSATETAEKLLMALLEQSMDPDAAAASNHALGIVKTERGNYAEALGFYQRALIINQNNLPADHPALASSHSSIGETYQHMGDYSKAMSHCEAALGIRQRTLPANHPNLASSHNNIGLVYDDMGEYSKALSHCEAALGIRQRTLPANYEKALDIHPDLASSHNNIGLVYDDMGEYSKALSHCEAALGIRQRTLPANHPDLASSHNNIGLVYDDMGEYSKALSHCEAALGIRQRTLPANHPNLASSHNNIGLVYSARGEYSKAMSHYEKALDILQKTLPANHPDLASSHNNIGLVYDRMGEYSKALSHSEKALDILQTTLPANHPNLASSHNNIGLVYDRMGEYSKALSHCEAALGIRQKTLPADHPDLASSHNNIGLVYDDMGEYSKALLHCEKALDILQTTLPANHPNLATSHSDIGLVYNRMGEYSTAMSHFERALDMRQKTLPANHPDLACSHKNIGLVYDHTGEYRKALWCYEKALGMQQKTLSENHPDLLNTHNHIRLAYSKMEQYRETVVYF